MSVETGRINSSEACKKLGWGMGCEVVFQIERTIYAETLKWQGGSACSREGREAAVPGPVRGG